MLLDSTHPPPSDALTGGPLVQSPHVENHWVGDATWAAIANLSQAAGPYCSLLLLARWKGLDAAGIYAFSQSLSTPALQLLSLQLKPLLLTLHPSELPFQLAIYLRSWSSLIGCVLAAIALVFQQPVLAVLLLCRLSESWGELYQTRWQLEANMPLAALASLARAGFQIASIAFMPTLLSGLTVYLACSLLLLVLLELRGSHGRSKEMRTLLSNWPLKPLSSYKLSAADSLLLWRILRRGLVLGGVLFLIALQSSLPRILLEHYHGPSVLGVFATLGLVSQFGNLFFSSCGQGLLPRFCTARMSQILTWLAIPALLGLAALLPLYHFREPLIFALIGTKAMGQKTLTSGALSQQVVDGFLAICVMQCVIWPAAIAGYALTAFRLYRAQVWLIVLMLATSLSLSLLLIPATGAVGAAVASGLASLVFLLASVFTLARSRSPLFLHKKVFT